MLQIEYLRQFKKDFKLAVKRGCDIAQLQKVITLLASNNLCRSNTVTML